MANSIKDIIDKSTLFGFDQTTGEVIPQTSSVLDSVKTLMKNIFGNKLLITDESPAGRLCEAIAIAISRFSSITAIYANQINPQYATGQMLDAIGSVFSVVRAGATPTIISCEFAGDVGTVIKAGSIIGSNRGVKFAVQTDLIIPAGGTVSGRAVCTEPGIITVDNGTITNIESSTVGWSSVVNTGTISVGTDIESDLRFRQRILMARWTGTAFVDSIRSEIERIDKVDSVFVVENVYAQNMYLDSNLNLSETEPEPEGGKYIILAPHSICVIVYGESLIESDNVAIAEAIHKTKSAGCGFTSLSEATQYEYKGEEVVQDIVDEHSGVLYSILFNKPIKIDFGVEITVNKNRYGATYDKLEEDVKNAIISWAGGKTPFVDGLSLGQNVYSYEIGAAVSDVIPAIQIKNVSITHGETYSEKSSEIEVFVNEIGILNPEEIKVTII